MKEIKENELFYFDCDNNKITKSKYTKEQAKIMIESCTGCKDCKDCEDCTYCTGCSGCTGCTGCADCEDCRYCRHCTDCKGCEDCSDCSRCSDCAVCLHCSYCTDCSRCSDCSDCLDCSGCSDCKDFKKNPERITSKKIGSRNENTTIYFNCENLELTQVVCGCFRGNILEFEEKVDEVYGLGNKNGLEYNHFIQKVKKYITEK